jgi:HK97 family phage portal protein
MANLLERLATNYLEKRAKRIKLPGGITVPRQFEEDKSGLTLSAVWAAVMLLSGHLSSVPLNLYRRLPNGAREKAVDHPLWKTLHSEPYPGLSSVEFREALVANIELTGVGYAQMTFYEGRIHLLPFNSQHVTPHKDRGVYEINNGTDRYEVPAMYMMVFPTLTLDGFNPLHTPYKRQRSISLAISYEQRAQAYNTNGSIPSGVAIWGEGYNRLNESEKKRLEKRWEQLYQGVANSGGTAFLPQGSDFKAITFNPETLQMLGSREFSIQEIARWFGIKPHKLADLSRATFSNIEHLSIEHIQDTILPRARKLESILTLALIPEEQREELFIEFNLDGLQRGDLESRMKSYSIGKQWGWLSTNDIRALENMNPLSSEQGGDLYLVPLNMMPANQVGSMVASSGERNIREKPTGFTRTQMALFRAAATVRRNITNAYKPAFERSQKALTKTEVEQVRAAAEQHLPQNLPGFIEFLDNFYSENDFTPRIRDGVQGVIGDYAKQIEAAALEEIGMELEDETDMDRTISEYINYYAIRHAKSSKGQLKALAKEANAEDDKDSLSEVNERLDHWEETRPGKFKEQETIRGEGAFSKSTWMLAGITKLIWVAFGDNCPYCDQLNGKVVGIQQYFVGKGTGIEADGQEPIIPSSNIGHPPLHEGCDCGISAVIGG